MPFEVAEDMDEVEKDNWFAGKKTKGGFFTAPYLETRRRRGKERVTGNVKYNDMDLGDDRLDKPGERSCR